MYNIESLPKNPGCYLFKDKKNRVIYIGKAKNIRKRVGSYFSKNHLDPKTQVMISRVEDIDFVVTDNEVEALVLENTLIKNHQPKYNVRLKDAKSHSYIKVTKEKYPRVMIAHWKKGECFFYGPFVTAAERDYILRFIKKNFLVRTCKRMPKKACLRHHIGLCEAPCVGNISQEDYSKKIDNVKMVLSGHVKNAIKKLHDEMDKHSKNQEYEKALRLRNQILALEYLDERQNMQREKKYDEDILNYIEKDQCVYLMIFNIYKGTLTNKNEFIFEKSSGRFLEEFLVQFYSENSVPKELILPEKIDPAIIDFLKEKKGSSIHVKIPKRGEKKQLLNLVLKNIESMFFADSKKVDALKNSLNLNERPVVIECFDISHLSGTSTVGSMVQFRNGRPDKQNYRRFKIRTVEGVDDFAAISEVVHRRYKRLKIENKDMPDLVVIDGGRGQLNAALSELKKLNVNIPIISIAKQLEEIYIPGEEEVLCLNKRNKGLHFLQEVRDEAHRFAIKYNRLLRSKKLVSK